jgi:hypothetical protein
MRGIFINFEKLQNDNNISIEVFLLPAQKEAFVKGAMTNLNKK